MILTESWMKDNVLLPGFKTFSNSAQKFHKKKSGRLSGGMVLGKLRIIWKMAFPLLNHALIISGANFTFVLFTSPPETLLISIPIFFLT